MSEVNPIQKSMTLINVRGFGTEGRRNGVNEIPPVENEIAEVQFKVDQIKDFKVIGKPEIVQLDPAIISISRDPKPPA